MIYSFWRKVLGPIAEGLWLNKMWFFKIFLDIPCISHFPLLAPICT